MKTLLLIEDETGHAELMSRVLSAAGYAVTLAGTLAEARAAITRKLPVLALADYNLPDGTGSELIAHVAGGFPIVLMTAHGDERLAVQAVKAGALDYLVKSPAMFEQLPHSVERALREWDLELERQRMMRALRESEERYRRITEGLTDYLYSVRVEQGLAVATTHGAACVVVTGYTAAEFAADTFLWIRMIVPDDRDRVLAHLNRVLAGEQLPTVEHRIVRKDGQTRWVSDQSILHLDAARRLTGYDGVIQDITARKRTEAALRESEERYAKVFHDAPVWIALTDLADGTYQEVNEQVLKDSGYSRAEMIGRTAVQIGLITAAERAPVMHAIQTRGRIFGEEMRFRTKDNRALCGLLNGERIDVDGRPCLLTVTIDITARKQAEEALKRERSLFDSLIRTIPDMVWLKDLNGVFLACNPVFERYFGAKKTEIVGKTDYDFVARETADVYRAGDRAVVAGGQPVVSESWLSFLEDGRHGLFESIKATVFDGAGKPAGVLGIARDITARKQAEAALRQSEARYRALIELSPEAVFVYAADQIVFANRAAALLVAAATPGALRSRTVREFVQPEFREAFDQWMGQMAGGGGAVPLMRQSWRRLDDTRVEVMVVATQLEFNGHPATLVIAMDVTAQRQAEAALRKLSRAVEQSPVTVVITDTTGAIEYVNPSFTATTGYTFEEVRGRNSRILQSGEVPAMVYRELWSTISAGREWRGEFHNRKKNGELFWEATTISPIADEEGEITHFLAVKEDITARKVAETRIHEQAALLEVTQDAILVLGLDREIMFWNRGAENLYGIVREQAMGRRYETTAYPKLPAEFDAEWGQFLMQGAWAAERLQVSQTRGAITVQIRATLVRDDRGKAKSALLVVTDITERKKLETQFLRAQRLESLGALASGVAHDLNNVLTPILMAVELLRPLSRNKSDDEMLQLLNDSARRGADIVQQLLLFGRGSDAPRAPMNAAGVIREVGQMMRQTFPKNLVLSVQAPADLWLIEADRTQVHQVLLNLCVNARDAMPRGGRLAVVAENRHVDEALALGNGGKCAGAYVRIEVKDSGTGIPAAHREKIFDPFFTTKPTGQGTGLGLATVLGIVRSHGGFLTVDSQENIGSVFEVYFPAVKSVVETAGDDCAPVTLMGHGEWVLVVDDEEMIRGVLQRVLLSHGYHVLTANDGAEALGVFAQNSAKVNLIVTDAMMPVMDGAEMMSALRRLNPGLPVVMISGLTERCAEYEKKFGPRIRFLPKPFPANLVIRRVHEVLDEAYGPKPTPTA